MKILSTMILATSIGFGASAQTTIANGGFENWGGNSSPGVAAEPTGWYSNKSGSSIAVLGGQTCFQETAIFHSGTSCVRVETISGPLSTAINGNVTTGVVSAPSFTKTDGYIGTRNFSDTNDIRRMAFTGRPDSIVGWYQYHQGATTEKGKVRVILHTGHYYDPETPTTNHPDPTANKIADALFFTPLSDVTTWTRFSVPFSYVSAATPAYIMINMTSSADQATTVTGSKLWIDDLQPVYNPPVNGIAGLSAHEDDVLVYAAGKTIFTTCSGNLDGSILLVSDLSGRVVFSQGITTERSFSLPYLNTGLYVYQLANAAFSIKGKLFIQ